MSEQNQQVVLARRPSGPVTPEDFRLIEAKVPELAEGHVLVRNQFLSLDPYMRGRMSDAKSYAAPQALDAVMGGATVGTIVRSKHAGFAAGDEVMCMLGGWQLYSALDARLVHKVDTRRVPLSAYLGAVGMPGVTAWYGLFEVCKPKAGETVVVSAAAGAVGSVVGQLAKQHGCRVIGIAGGAAKCEHVVRDLGFDVCVDYKAGNLRGALAAAAPSGVDCVFENVAGEVLDASLARMNPFGRVALCGAISGYNGESTPLQDVRSLLINRLTVRGFIISDHLEVWPRALADLGERVATGKLKYRETMAEGLASAPQAFIGMLAGKNLGKQLVKLI